MGAASDSGLTCQMAATPHRGESPRKNPRAKGGISAMAKKTAKGGKKKGGKKR
jgi:hypothetical protein